MHWLQIVLIGIADLATFVYLMWVDIAEGIEGWQWVSDTAVNFLLAQIWPIYWGLIHWL